MSPENMQAALVLLRRKCSFADIRKTIAIRNIKGQPFFGQEKIKGLSVSWVSFDEALL